jgi:hypothetical protein
MFVDDIFCCIHNSVPTVIDFVEIGFDKLSLRVF